MAERDPRFSIDITGEDIRRINELILPRRFSRHLEYRRPRIGEVFCLPEAKINEQASLFVFMYY